MINHTTRGNNVFIDGLYIGQPKSVRWGSKERTKWIGPHLVSWDSNGDSITFRTLFDPDKSEFVNKVVTETSIAYLQVMEFSVNGIPCQDISKYDSSLDIIEPLRGKKRTLDGEILPAISNKWLDIPVTKADGKPNEFPFYAMWTASTKQGIGPHNIKTYPQRYGAIVDFPATTKYGQYRIPFLDKSIELGLGNFHSGYDYNDYLLNIETEDFDLKNMLETGYEIPEKIMGDDLMDYDIQEANKEVWRQVDKVVKEVEHELLQQKGMQRTQYNKQQVFGRGNRIYLKFSFFDSTNPSAVLDSTAVLIYPLPRDPNSMDTGESKFAWSFMDEELFENTIDYNLMNGPIDVKWLYDTYPILNNQNGDTSSVKLNYTVYSFACQFFIKPNSPLNTLQINLLEGIKWDAERLFYKDKEADEATVKLCEKVYFPRKWNAMVDIDVHEDSERTTNEVKNLIETSLKGHLIEWIP